MKKRCSSVSLSWQQTATCAQQPNEKGVFVFFNSWSGLARIAVVAPLAYLALVLLLRVSGKRTLTKMNAFDLVVTVAMGSTLATVLLSKDIALVEGVLAFAALIYLQFAITWLSVRSSTVDRLVKAEPRLVLYQGDFLQQALRDERVTEGEVLAAVRGQGITELESVAAVILETDGSFSVVTGAAQRPHSALANVTGYRAET